MIRCAGCQKEFESKGLRSCSAQCERRYRESQDNRRVAAEAGIELAAKRRCVECGTVIPKWRNGRQVSKAARFCSARCRQREKAKGASGAKPAFIDALREKSAHSTGLNTEARKAA